MRGLYIATGQYSSLCVSAVVLTLGGVDIEDVPDREQVDCEREKVEVGEKQERETNTKRQQTHAQKCDIMDGMRMERMRTEDTLSQMWCDHTCKVHEKKHV